jgi:hypothetical protein
LKAAVARQQVVFIPGPQQGVDSGRCTSLCQAGLGRGKKRGLSYLFITKVFVHLYLGVEYIVVAVEYIVVDIFE